MKRRTGHIPDPEGHRLTQVHHLVGAPRASKIPASFSLRGHMAGIFDQGDTSSCVAHAIIGASMTRLNAIGTPVMLPSFETLYKLARSIDRPVDASGFPTEALVDEGCQPNQAMRAIDEWGIGSRASSFPLNTKTINEELTLTELEDDTGFRLEGYYGIDAGSGMSDACALTIASGFPIPLATIVDNAFENFAGGATLTAPNLANNDGSHYIYLVDFETAPSGKRRFAFANSWGDSWGEGGFGWADEAWLAMATNLYAMNVSRDESPVFT